MNEPVKATVKMSKQSGITSMQGAGKATKNLIDNSVIPTDLFIDMGGVSSYRITAVGTEGSMKNVYVWVRPLSKDKALGISTKGRVQSDETIKS